MGKKEKQKLSTEQTRQSQAKSIPAQIPLLLPEPDSRPTGWKAVQGGIFIPPLPLSKKTWKNKCSQKKKSKKLLHCCHRIITLGAIEKESNYVSSALFIHQQKMSVHNLDNSVCVNISLKLMWLRGCGNTGSGTHRCLLCQSQLPDKTNRQTKGPFLCLDTEIDVHINSGEHSERNKDSPDWSLAISSMWKENFPFDQIQMNLLFADWQGNPSGIISQAYTFLTKSRCSIKLSTQALMSAAVWFSLWWWTCIGFHRQKKEKKKRPRHLLRMKGKTLEASEQHWTSLIYN